MYSFKNDYSEGAHPSILTAITENNMAQEEGYGMDRHSLNAIRMIKELIGDQKAGVHLISGGTQTNLIAVSGFLRPHHACITPKTGHIAVHETGAIEATGHKLLTVDTVDGKLTQELIAPVLEDHYFEHMVKPAMVYISNPTELGTVYSKSELAVLYDFCRAEKLLLYADGARLGAALTAQEIDLTLKDMYELTDAFFIGATKTGALMGEALVLKNVDLKEDFRYLLKQRGALLAKGRILGIQFETLFEDGLYFELARNANKAAQSMADELLKNGCRFLIHSTTNQIFPIMENETIAALSRQFDFYTWEKVDNRHSAIRIITSWATPESAVKKFVEVYKKSAC